MIEIKNSSENYIRLYFHIIYYFVIIYICHYFIFYREKEDYIENNVKSVLDDRKIFENLELRTFNRRDVEVIKRCNIVTQDDNDKILYDIIMYVIIFASSIVFMILIGKFYKLQVRRILYEGLIFFLFIFLLKIFFIYNVQLNYDRPSQRQIYDNIINILNENIKLK